MAKKEIKKQQEQIIINTLDCIIWDLVDNLRKIRAEEKRAQQCIVDVIPIWPRDFARQASDCPVI